MKAVIATVNDFSTIAVDGKLPWFDIPELKKLDMGFFKKETMGQHILVGRKTWENDLKGKPLDGRFIHFVLSSKNVQGDCRVISSVQDIYNNLPYNTVCIGGGSLYDVVLPICNCVHWTHFIIPGIEGVKTELHTPINSLLNERMGWKSYVEEYKLTDKGSALITTFYRI